MSNHVLPRALAGLALLFSLAVPSGAVQEARPEEWTWRVAPYLWAAGIDGTLTKDIGEAEFEVDFSDIWDNLESGGLIYVETRRERFSIFGDAVFLALDADGETILGGDADLDLDTTIVELGGLYRLTPTSPLELGLGMRYAHFESDLQFGILSSDGSRDSFDGLAVGRATWPFATRWYAELYGDIGAGDADLTWQASAMLGLQLGGWGLGAGYRMLDYDFEEGSDELDFSLSGPVFGAEFRF